MRRRTPLAGPLLAFAVAASACSDGSGPRPRDPSATADRLEELAREAAGAGDEDRADALAVAAAGVRTAGAVSRLRVTEGTSSADYDAIVLELTLTIPAHDSPFAGPIPEETLALRQLMAWSEGDARRMMTVATLDGDTADFSLFDSFTANDDVEATPPLGSPSGMGMAMITRGPRDLLFGAGGGAGIHLTSAGGACHRVPPGASTCEQAAFTANGRIVFEGFDLGQLELLPDADPFTGERLTVQFAPQPVIGARLTATCGPQCFGPIAPGLARATTTVLARGLLSR
ncbi:MAG TPA: hypothetical protein VNA89_10525 [Gemmatimonadaceae bacterium]|nr:hypothetical protein [Gemmatimonadaceae bacterium]